MPLRAVLTAIVLLGLGPPATAQITAPRKLSASPDRYANIQEQLVNRLRAFDQEKRGYVEMVVKQIRQGRLDLRLVLAVQRYAIQRNAEYPFPFFERALRFEAGRRGVPLPTVRQFASTAEARRATVIRDNAVQ